jgi:hypothetical protein
LAEKFPVVGGVAALRIERIVEGSAVHANPARQCAPGLSRWIRGVEKVRGGSLHQPRVVRPAWGGWGGWHGEKAVVAVDAGEGFCGSGTTGAEKVLGADGGKVTLGVVPL